jgi:hypothetical protein
MTNTIFWPGRRNVKGLTITMDRKLPASLIPIIRSLKEDRSTSQNCLGVPDQIFWLLP